MKRFSLTSMRRVFIFVLLISFGSIILNAQSISEDVARKKAASFFLDNKKGIKAIKGKEDHSALEDSLKLIEGDDAYYIFNLESKGGYVIVSGDDRMPAVLGYSMEGCFKEENMPDNLRAWLDGYKEQYQYLQTHEDAITVSETTTASESRTKIYPLLTTSWGQGAPYNEQCPESYGYPSPTGCVATAMAQIMNYHQWPNQTSKTIEGYTTNTEKINVPAIDVTTIDWDNMMDIYRSNSSENQRNAVSTLMKLCGAAVQMNYFFLDSRASILNARNAFVEYFGYDETKTSLINRNNYNSEDWTELIYEEIKNKRPVLYAGESDEGNEHAFVIDGYDKDDYFHINWGWNGSSDGYYLLVTLPSYNYNQEAIVGIKGQKTIQHKYPYAEYKNSTITFYYDNLREQREGEVNIDLKGSLFPDRVNEITTVTFNSSFANYHDLSTTSSWFYGCSNLSRINGLKYLKTENVTSMYAMFAGCSELKSLDLSTMTTSNVTDMDDMFLQCKNLQTLNVSGFDTQKVSSMQGMFYGCESLQSLDLSSFDTRNVQYMNVMFHGCKKITKLDLTNFDTNKVKDMYCMFYGCESLEELNISSFSTHNVTRMGVMFYSCKKIKELNLNHFDTKNVIDMGSMFAGCESLESLKIDNFDTQNVVDMSAMFASCKKLATLDISSFNTSNVTDMGCMFLDCNSLSSLDVSNFNTSSVTRMAGMFSYCTKLTSLDISSFNTSNVTDMSDMFAYCFNLAVIYCKEGTDWSSVTESTNMFYYCSKLRGYCKGRTTNYSSDKTDATLARICTSTQDGYFTLKGTEVKTAKVLWDNTKKTLVFFYDGKAYELPYMGSNRRCDHSRF